MGILKNLGLIIILCLTLCGCSKDLDVELNENPFDPDYSGEAVVSISSVEQEQWQSFGNGNVYERIKIKVNTTISNYTAIKLYRNGTEVYSGLHNDMVYDYLSAPWFLSSPLLAGNTYSFQVALANGSGRTALTESTTYTVN